MCRNIPLSKLTSHTSIIFIVNLKFRHNNNLSLYRLYVHEYNYVENSTLRI